MDILAHHLKLWWKHEVRSQLGIIDPEVRRLLCWLFEGERSQVLPRALSYLVEEDVKVLLAICEILGLEIHLRIGSLMYNDLRLSASLRVLSIS